MNKLPFVLPDKDINLHISVISAILNELSTSKRGKLLLTLDRLAIFEFLIKNPFVLYEVVKTDLAIPYFALKDNEIGSIGTKYINKKNLFDYVELKKVIQLLLLYEIVEIKRDKNEIFYVITPKGRAFVNDLESVYFQRVKELCNILSHLTSIPISKLKLQINPIIGV
jgi:predicted transcriptional regulator